MSRPTTIWSHSACEQTGIQAKWSERSQKWICPTHHRSSCVATFQNMSLLDKLAEGDKIAAEHPSWPTPAEIKKRNKFLKKLTIYHHFDFWIEEPLTLEQWHELDDRFDIALKGIKHGGTAGPLPER